MKSPFPGMDPYLEKHWHEVHQRLIIYAGDLLQERLPPQLRARVEERVILELEADEVRSIYPDVYVVERPQSAGLSAETGSAVAIEEEPVLVTVQDERPTEGYIEIVDATSGNRVVTVIEFLSPTNKVPGEDRVRFQQKQAEVKRAGANVVEIDLTRIGRRTLLLAENDVPTSHHTTYRICTWRAGSPGHFEIYRTPLLRPLPSIRIPLRPTDADVRLDLQPLVDRCYAMGRYDFDYRAEPNPPLDAEDAQQADEWLRAKGLR